MRRDSRRRVAVDLLVIVALALVSYFVRLGDLPVMGEEARRARSAIHMIETGDWIVVQNQGVVFPDRPPMTNWLMAWLGLARGTVDLVAIRLPSMLAVLLTAWVLYGYCRRLGSRFEALTAPAVFLTFGQTLQLGRLGESEAAFVLFVAAALLVWHLGYVLGWSRTLTWTVGYTLAALGALTKGLQAPIYFVGTTAAFLAWRREWRWLLGRGQWIGAAIFLAIVMAWQIPYYLATDWPSVVGTWFAVVGPRLAPSDLASHLAIYPLEVLASLLPWSPVLLLALAPAVRSGLRAGREHDSRLAFVLTSIVVTFPTVWFSAGAKPRYYMPLHPLIALAIAMILGWCAAAGRVDADRGPWRRFVVGAAVAVLVLVAIVGAAFVVQGETATGLRPTPAWLTALILAAAAALAALWAARRGSPERAKIVAVLATALFFGVFHGAAVLNHVIARYQDAGPGVAALRTRLPGPVSLVSFGPIHTNFLYFWGELVPEIPWPREIEDLPPEVDYFAFDRRPGDTPESRLATRGMVEWTTPGTLPFAWEEIGAVDSSKKQHDPPHLEVVVGRVLRDADGRPLPAAR